MGGLLGFTKRFKESFKDLWDELQRLAVGKTLVFPYT